MHLNLSSICLLGNMAAPQFKVTILDRPFFNLFYALLGLGNGP